MLRKLKTKDAILMLEWMHDANVIRNMQTNFISKSIDDCLDFIKDSENDDNNCHLAIVDDNDEYMGTVSLKHIIDGNAEFAITIRSVAMGKGISKSAMEEIIEIGFDKYNLDFIYWCVSPDNERAVHFYDKNGYHRLSAKDLNVDLDYTEEQVNKSLWYIVEKENN